MQYDNFYVKAVLTAAIASLCKKCELQWQVLAGAASHCNRAHA